MTKKKPFFYGPGDSSTGPYSPALTVGEWVFISGQGPLDPATHEIRGDDIEAQTELTMQNVKAALEAAGATLEDCVRVTVHLSDIANYDRFNKVYTKHFQKPYPTRTLVQSVLWHHILVEIDAIAIKGCGGGAA